MKKWEKILILCMLVILIVALVIFFRVNGKREEQKPENNKPVQSSEQEKQEGQEATEETEETEADAEKEYELKINSKDYGTPEKGAAIFATSFNIENVEGTCRVEYLGLYPDNLEANYPDLNKYKNIEIGEKKYHYKDEGTNEVSLIYVENENCYVIIRVSLLGNPNAKINDTVLKSAELAKALDFAVVEK